MIEGLLIILWSVAVSIGQGPNVVGVWLIVIVPRVLDAIDRTRTERDQLRAERDAFKQFAKRVATLDPDKHITRVEYETPPSVIGTGVTTLVDPVGQTSRSTVDVEPISASLVRDAYCETVMSVPHYEEEYDESLGENLTEELGPELAQTLIESDVITPQLQAAVVSQARQVSKERGDLLSHVETEYESLVEARRQLRELYKSATTIEDDLYPRPVRELVQSWTRLKTLTTDCETLLRDRQTHLKTEPSPGTKSMWSFQEYLYQSFHWRHPVLYDGLETLTRIRRAKRKTVKAIYNR